MKNSTMQSIGIIGILSGGLGSFFVGVTLFIDFIHWNREYLDWQVFRLAVVATPVLLVGIYFYVKSEQ